MKSAHYKKRISTLALLAMVLSFMAQITPLWLSQPANGTPIVICSAFGTKTIIIDENGQKIPQTVTQKSHCTMCLVASMAITPPAILHALPHPPTITSKQLWHTQTTSNTTAFLAQSHQIRAPPAYS